MEFLELLMITTTLLSVPVALLWLVVQCQRCLTLLLHHFDPSTKRVVLVTIISTALCRWPSLRGCPIEEIANVISQFWRGRVDSSLVNKELSIQAAAPQDKTRPFIQVPEEHGTTSPTCADKPLQRVAIVLERRKDRSLWVIEFNQPASVTNTRSCALKTLRLNPCGGTVPDMVDTAAKFVSARDHAPSAPWRVLGFHDDPITLPSSPSHSTWINKGFGFNPFDEDHPAEHFSYSQSHDPVVEIDFNALPDDTDPLTYYIPFWNSSARAQVLAWSLIKSQLCTTSSRTAQDLYSQFGIEPHLAELNLAITLEKEEFERRIEAEKALEEQDREQRRRDLEEAAERRQQRLDDANEIVRQEAEARDRKEAFWQRKMKKYRQRQSGMGWSGRLRPTRNP